MKNNLTHILPFPVNTEETIDALSFFEQIFADYYLEYGENYDLIKNLRLKLIDTVCAYVEGKDIRFERELWNICTRYFHKISKSEIVSLSPLKNPFYTRPKIPECRSYLPVELNDVIYNSFLFSENLKNTKEIFIIGIRSAGSWGGGILGGVLKVLGFDVKFITVRPLKIRKLNINQEIYDKLNEKYEFMCYDTHEIITNDIYLGLGQHNDANVILVDDPPDSGYTLNCFAKCLKKKGICNIRFFPLGNCRNCSIDQGLITNNYNYYQYNTFNYKLLNQIIAKKYGLKLPTIYESTVPREIQFSIKKHQQLFEFKYVGAGWFGKIEFLRAQNLKGIIPDIYGIENGYLIYKKIYDNCNCNVGHKLDSALKYCNIVEKYYSFRKQKDIVFVWHSNKFSKKNWGLLNGNLIRINFDGGHWAKLIDIVYFYMWVLIELGFTDKQIINIVKNKFNLNQLQSRRQNLMAYYNSYNERIKGICGNIK